MFVREKLFEMERMARETETVIALIKTLMALIFASMLYATLS